MNKKSLLLALVSFLIGFSACNENDDEQPNTIPLIKTEAVYSGDSLYYTLTYEYDQDNRITKETSDLGDYTTFSYEPGKIIKKEYFSVASNPVISELILNDKGLVVKEIRPTNEYSYEYDSEGYLVKFVIPDQVQYIYTIVDGNTAQVYDDNITKTLVRTTIHQFLPSINTIGNENKGMAWLGKQDQNLVAEHFVKIKNNSDNWQYIVYFTYEFDAQNRVTKKVGIHETMGKFHSNYTYY